MRHVSYFNNIKQQKQKQKREEKETYITTAATNKELKYIGCFCDTHTQTPQASYINKPFPLTVRP